MDDGLGYVGPRVGSTACNLVVLGNPSMVRQKVDREVQLGRVAGPFPVLPRRLSVVPQLVLY